MFSSCSIRLFFEEFAEIPAGRAGIQRDPTGANLHHRNHGSLVGEIIPPKKTPAKFHTPNPLENADSNGDDMAGLTLFT